MVLCKNCKKQTSNKKFCSQKCRLEYKFKHGRKNRSKLEKYISKRIKEEFYLLKVKNNDRQILEENLELDIYIPNLNIAFEIQGQMHYKFIKYFHHTYDNFIKQQLRDRRKKILCYKKNIILIYIENFTAFTIDNAEDIYQKKVRPILISIINQRRFL